MSKVYKKTAKFRAEPFVMQEIKGSGHARFGAGVLRAGSIEKDAYEKGFSTGEKAGFEFGKKKAEALYKGLEGVLSEVSSFKESMYRASEEEVTALAIAIAKKVIQREVSLKRDIVLDSVRAALKAVVATSEVLIKVNPKDLEVINQFKGEILKGSGDVKSVSFEADEAIGRGGCVIETNYGEIDATVTGILAEIEERLRNAE